jgi:hypothetical protein
MLVRFRCPSCYAIQLRGTSSTGPYDAAGDGTNKYRCGACKNLIDGEAIQAGRFDMPEKEDNPESSDGRTTYGYQPRIVALLDLLGFSEVVASSSRNPQMISVIHSALAAMRKVFPQWDDSTRPLEEAYKRAAVELEPALRDSIFGEHELFRTSMFSDNVAFSGPPDPNGFIVVLATSAFLWLHLLSRGFLLRGGIAIGELRHSEREVFGPALVEAHQLESRVARFPRLVLSERLVEVLRENEKSGFGPPLYSHMLRRDLDGIHHINTLGYFVAELTAQLPARAGFFESLRQAIVHNIRDDSQQDSRVREKWVWLGSYFNETVIDEPWLPVEPVDVPAVCNQSGAGS